MYKKECIDKYVQKIYKGQHIQKNVLITKFRQIDIDFYVDTYCQANMYRKLCIANMYICMYRQVQVMTRQSRQVQNKQIQNRIDMYLILQTRVETRVQN